MQTPDRPRTVANIALCVSAVLMVACATSTKRMTSLPPEGSAQRGEVPRTVVLFRVITGNDGKPAAATLSTLPKWKWHFLVNVGPPGRALGTGGTFGAGQFDTTVRQAGWGFLTLPAGSYQLAFAAYRTRFAMPGAQRAALGFGESDAFQFEVPAAASLLYVGTFDFTCRNADRWWGYVEHECTKVEVRDERDLALEVASAALPRFEPMQTALASMRSAEQPR